jgi:serine/threonine protein kinase
VTDSNSPQHRSSSSSSGLILRVRRGDGSTADLYIAAGMTIGRSEANTVSLPNDESVDRSHARVEMSVDGCLCLRAQSATGPILEGGESVTELMLQPGQTFRIGGAEFECLSGLVETTPRSTKSLDRCPNCDAGDIDSDGHLPRPCHVCGTSLLPVRNVEAGQVQFVPASYGDYTALRYVARGGMGMVLQGLSEDGRTQVAIKLLISRGDQSDAVRRFREEVRALERIDHPHVVRVLGSGETSGFSYLVMEWVDGQSLREIIRTNREASRYCDAATATRWFHEVLQGLSVIHAAGMVHRDIKPANILVTSDGRARVSDLGLVKQLGEDATACTTTGMAPGTFGYMSPEQLSSSAEVDERSDLYSLGVTFYELLTGERPHGVWTPPSDINSGVSTNFDNTICDLLSRNPEIRAHGVSGELSSAPMNVVVPSAARNDDSSTLETTKQTPHDAGHGVGWMIVTIAWFFLVLTGNELWYTAAAGVVLCTGLCWLDWKYQWADQEDIVSSIKRLVSIPFRMASSQSSVAVATNTSDSRAIETADYSGEVIQLTACELQPNHPVPEATVESCDVSSEQQAGVLDTALGCLALIGIASYIIVGLILLTDFSWSGVGVYLLSGLALLIVLGSISACASAISNWWTRESPNDSQVTDENNDRPKEVRLWRWWWFIGIFLAAGYQTSQRQHQSNLERQRDPRRYSRLHDRTQRVNSATVKKLRSPDSLFEITVPEGWDSSTELSEFAGMKQLPMFEAGDSTQDVILLVVHELKDSPDTPTLNEYMNLKLNEHADSTDGFTRSQLVVGQVDGYAAEFTEVVWGKQVDEITYHVTIIDTPGRFFTIICFSRSHAAAARAAFEKIAPTFVCLDAGR